MSTRNPLNSYLSAIRLAAASTGLALVLAGGAAAEAGALKGAMTAQIITLDEAGQEVAAPAEAVEPGGVIEYALSYRNTSDDRLSALVIDGPIPAETAYLAGSQLASDDAVFEARAAGIDWQAPPLMREVRGEDGTVRRVEVPAEEYAAIRWKVADPLEPDAEVSFVYRVRVDR